MWINDVLFIFWITSCINAQSPILDSRCYLEGGGSAESFLATEDMAIGSIIGKLRINGNPHKELGDINLSLRERGAAIEISPGTKNLVLITALDKEGVDGPSSVYVNVICDRRHSSDPSFVIPVNIRVTDINDNAPQWIGAPYSLPLSEVTVPGTRILQGARAIDKDQQGPFSTVEYKVLTGPYSDYVQFVSPLEGTLVLRKPLDYEILKNFTITLRAQDHGAPPKYSDTKLHVIVEDADDQNPKFLKDSYHTEIPSDSFIGELICLPEPIKAIDQDEGLRAPVQYSIMSSIESKYFQINTRTGIISIISAVGALNLLHPITLVIRATQTNNPDRYALTTLIANAKDADKQNGKRLSFLQSKFHIKIPENTNIGNRLLALPTNRPGRFLRYAIMNKNDADQFTVGSLGEIILQKSLDFEKKSKHIFDVMATDGISNATTEVNVDVLDVNDWEPRFRENHYDFIIPVERSKSSSSSLSSLNLPSIADSDESNENPIALGKLEAADGDKNDRVTIVIRGAYSNHFMIDTSGTLWLKNPHLIPENITLMHLIATATDNGMPPRSSSVPVTLQFEGVAMAQGNWTPGVLGAFGVCFTIFVLVIMSMSIYIWKQRKPNMKNRVHNSGNNGNTGGPHERNGGGGNTILASTTNLMNHEKINTRLQNVRLTNPLNNNNNHSDKLQRLTTASSMINMTHDGHTMLATNLEREAAKRQRERDKDNYTATVRSIISRASAAHGIVGGGGFYESAAAIDMDEDSISNSDIGKSTITAWNIPHEINNDHQDRGINSNNNNDHCDNEHHDEMNAGVLQRSIKKLSWRNGHRDDGVGIAGVGVGIGGNHHFHNGGTSPLKGKTELTSSMDNMGSTENNLTVYF